MRLLTGLLIALGVELAAPERADAQLPTASEAGSSVTRAGLGRVQPGDRLVLKVWREPLLSDTVMVDARGEVVLPKVGVVSVSRFTVLQLQDTLRARLDAYLRDPGVEVVVLRRLVVNGEVLKPGVYYVDIGTATLGDAIALAGGITANGHSQRVSVVRDGRRIQVPEWERTDASVADLQSGDQVVVARRSWLALNSGQVLGAVGLLTSVVVSIISLNR